MQKERKRGTEDKRRENEKNKDVPHFFTIHVQYIGKEQCAEYMRFV